MSDGRLVINFGSLHQASGDISNALNNMQAQLAQAEADAAPLVNTWDGQAKEAYHQRQEKWRAAAADLAAMLKDIKVALDTSAETYRDAEQRNANLFA